MTNRKRVFIIITIIVLCCGLMAVVDGIICPTYAFKSVAKAILFLGVPGIYYAIDKQSKILEIFKPNQKKLLPIVLLGVSIYCVIVGAYFVLNGLIDFSGITTALNSNIGVNKENFVFVSLYISFANSLLEEIFFRGFAFITLKNLTTRRFAYIFSSTFFALYHATMIIGWFSFGITLLVLISLFIGGTIFNFLNEDRGNIYTSWMVHMFANFGINTVGFILFGII